MRVYRDHTSAGEARSATLIASPARSIRPHRYRHVTCPAQSPCRDFGREMDCAASQQGHPRAAEIIRIISTMHRTMHTGLPPAKCCASQLISPCGRITGRPESPKMRTRLSHGGAFCASARATVVVCYRQYRRATEERRGGNKISFAGETGRTSVGQRGSCPSRRHARCDNEGRR